MAQREEKRNLRLLTLVLLRLLANRRRTGDLASEDGFEPPTYGFGDHRSANWNYSEILVGTEGIEPNCRPPLILRQVIYSHPSGTVPNELAPEVGFEPTVAFAVGLTVR